ncbi:MAG: hypothetical protein PHU23_01275 [Dehalococcoidales bacterium]|nr:hypothetical protein [Dehalococcoidales bacterium]
MNEQNRKYIQKEIGKLLSEIWRIKGLSKQEYGQQHSITKKLASMQVYRNCCKRNEPIGTGE